MAVEDDLIQNLDDISTLADQYLAIIAASDGEKAALKQTILDLTAGNAALQGKVATAFAKSDEVENKMRAGVPGVPPVGGTPLNTSYADRAAFDAAVAAYTGPESVTLDGTSVKTGTAGQLDYFTHSDSTPPGEINVSGPTS